MRVGRFAAVPYFPPGDETLAKAVEKLAGRHHAVLLANHGPVVAGSSSLANAQFATEELEETAEAVSDAAITAIRPRLRRSRWTSCGGDIIFIEKPWRGVGILADAGSPGTKNCSPSNCRGIVTLAKNRRFSRDCHDSEFP